MAVIPFGIGRLKKSQLLRDPLFQDFTNSEAGRTLLVHRNYPLAESSSHDTTGPRRPSDSQIGLIVATRKRAPKELILRTITHLEARSLIANEFATAKGR